VQVPVLIDAVLSVEDTRFYSHHGVDLRALARALIVDVWHGKVEEGGSTITQQLVKNVFLTHDRTVVRKVREAWLACVMERALSKDEILTLYLNEVYLGRYGHAGIHGFARASRLFFDKDVSDLELHEAALLAGLVRSPNLYSPHAHPARAIRRRNTVLMLMARHGRITGEQYARAAAMPLGIVPLETPARRAPYFVDHVISIVGSTAEGREALAAGGLKIYTTLDAHLQEVVENAVADGLVHRGAEMQAACVVIQPATGEILAMTGGRDYRASQFNRAVSLRRNIGSLIKPVVYYEALRKGYTLASVIDDAPVALRLEDGTVWSPENFDGASHGRVMLLQALANSYNQATVGLGLAVGLAEIGRTLGDMTDGVKAPPAPSLLLGAVPMSPLEVAGMYAVFAAGGGRPRPYALVAVTDERDAVIREHDPAPARRVADGRVVFLVNRALEEVLSRGTARSAEGMGIPGGVCGKTGTTNDLRDAWFAAFSGDLV
ncbi:MAG TPA: transglycosylase domain-containing protein, partial [Deltaproteobacteria bacterium]|nr:transglycosylase domain-containing protein [Deltaproteobacteria bacterium]